MSKPGSIGYAEFAAKVAADEEDAFTWSDLARFDYDAPRARCALVSWCDERVDEFGEVFAGHWRIVQAGDARRLSELHDWGVMFFGEPPWRRSQVVHVVGRLGSIEAAVKALAKPAPDFVYEFDWKAPVAPVAARRVSPAAAVEVLSAPRVARSVERRTRWRRAVRSPVQGELF